MIETLSSIHKYVIEMTTSKKDFILIILEAESYKNKIQDGRPRASYLGTKIVIFSSKTHGVTRFSCKTLQISLENE